MALKTDWAEKARQEVLKSAINRALRGVLENQGNREEQYEALSGLIVETLMLTKRKGDIWATLRAAMWQLRGGPPTGLESWFQRPPPGAEQ